MKFKQVIESLHDTTKGKVDILSKKPKRKVIPQDGGVADQGPSGLTGAVDILKKGKKK